METVAFMVDIQTMYYQLKVPESQRSYSRYLYGKEGAINSEIVDYEMSFRLLGAVSSPHSSSSYALKRTAANNSSSYGVDVSGSVMTNFYVDDLLKSDESEEYAVDLIKKLSKENVRSSLF